MAEKTIDQHLEHIKTLGPDEFTEYLATHPHVAAAVHNRNMEQKSQG